MVLYHGTDYESGENIIKKGFGRGLFETVWDCSDPCKTYLVSEDYDEGNGLSFAIEAARTAAAVKDSKETSVIIFKLEIDEDDLYNDSSCRDYLDMNVEMTDCYQIDSENLNQLIASGKVKMKIYELKDGYIPYLRIFYLPCDSPFLDFGDSILSDAVHAVNQTSASLAWLEDILYDYDFNNLQEKEYICL